MSLASFYGNWKQTPKTRVQTRRLRTRTPPCFACARRRHQVRATSVNHINFVPSTVRQLVYIFFQSLISVLRSCIFNNTIDAVIHLFRIHLVFEQQVSDFSQNARSSNFLGAKSQIVINLSLSMALITIPQPRFPSSVLLPSHYPRTDFHVSVFLTPSIVIFDFPSTPQTRLTVCLLVVFTVVALHVVKHLPHWECNTSLSPRMQWLLDCECCTSLTTAQAVLYTMLVAVHDHVRGRRVCESLSGCATPCQRHGVSFE